MLSTQISSTPTTSASVRIKTLHTTSLRDEQKDLEPEFDHVEEPANNQELTTSTDLPSEVTYSGLSSRASDIKSYLQDSSPVQAIVLKEDGSAQEFSFNVSSSATRKLLGRPQVVGGIEELNVVVLQSRDLSTENSVNQHTLPAPLCNAKANGDYVLFRVDSDGSPSDVSLKEYQQYVDSNKNVTATALKNYSLEEEPIRSSFHSISDDSIKSLRAALETRIWAESESIDITKQSDAEIQQVVREGIQRYVDEMVAASSPMNDPDYQPEDDQELSAAEEEEVESFEYEDTDDRSWRAQLNDALEHVKEIGRLDGAAFAERVSATFSELSMSAPALSDMTALYDRIKDELAAEAESELEDETESADSQDEEVVDDEEWEEALDHIRDVAQQQGESMAHDLCDMFFEEYGTDPTLSELKELWQGAQDELALEAQEQEEYELEESSSDYNPENYEDQYQAEQDLAEDAEYEMNVFGDIRLDLMSVEESEEESMDEDWEEALDHIRDLGRQDGEALAGNIFDLLCDVNEEAPSLEELEDVWYSIEEGLAEEAEEEMEDESESEFSEEETESEEESGSQMDSFGFSAQTVAADWISRATDLYLEQTGREPTEDELLDTIREFASDLADDVLGIESEEDFASSVEESVESEESWDEYESESDEEYDPDNSRDHVLARWDLEADMKHEQKYYSEWMMFTPVMESKSGGAVWNVYFDETELNQDSESLNMQKAVEMFHLRNQRVPTIVDLKRISEFLTVPKESVDAEQDEYVGLEPSKVLVSPLRESSTKKAKGFEVYLRGSKLGQKRSYQKAVQWFKKVNKREPDAKDLEKLSQFMEFNKDGVEEEEYLVPVKKLRFEQEDEEDNQEMIDIE